MKAKRSWHSQAPTEFRCSVPPRDGKSPSEARQSGECRLNGMIAAKDPLRGKVHLTDVQAINNRGEIVAEDCSTASAPFTCEIFILTPTGGEGSAALAAIFLGWERR
jgi:hypothetical protein